MGIWRLGRTVDLSQRKETFVGARPEEQGACSSPFSAVCTHGLLVLTYLVKALKITMFTTGTPSLETIPLTHDRAQYITTTLG